MKQTLAGKPRGASCRSSVRWACLREGARREFVNLPAALAQLQATTFYVNPELIRSLLEEDTARNKRRE
jgi:hypothetical protein